MCSSQLIDKLNDISDQLRDIVGSDTDGVDVSATSAASHAHDQRLLCRALHTATDCLTEAVARNAALVAEVRELRVMAREQAVALQRQAAWKENDSGEGPTQRRLKQQQQRQPQQQPQKSQQLHRLSPPAEEPMPSPLPPQTPQQQPQLIPRPELLSDYGSEDGAVTRDALSPRDLSAFASDRDSDREAHRQRRTFFAGDLASEDDGAAEEHSGDRSSERPGERASPSPCGVGRYAAATMAASASARRYGGVA